MSPIPPPQEASCAPHAPSHRGPGKKSSGQGQGTPQRAGEGAAPAAPGQLLISRIPARTPGLPSGQLRVARAGPWVIRQGNPSLCAGSEGGASCRSPRWADGNGAVGASASAHRPPQVIPRGPPDGPRGSLQRLSFPKGRAEQPSAAGAPAGFRGGTRRKQRSDRPPVHRRARWPRAQSSPKSGCRWRAAGRPRAPALRNFLRAAAGQEVEGAGAALGRGRGQARAPPPPRPAVAAPPAPPRPPRPEPLRLGVGARVAERGARGRREQSGGGEGGPGPGRAERATRRAFVSGGAGAAAAAGRPERRMRRAAGPIAERCGGGRRGARPGARGDSCV